MSLVLDIKDIGGDERELVGGKAYRLAVIHREGIKVPDLVAVSTDAFEKFVSHNGLRERSLLELNRKGDREMRWEEMWDASLRVRSFFLNSTLPEDLRQELSSAISKKFGSRPVAIRSSAPGEDSEKRSFAGLHDSYLNVRGEDAIIDHIILVWASLFSDRAILYRQELGLDFGSAKMAVLVQEVIEGEKSGVAFSEGPADSSQGIIEAVWGINQGLVDGSVMPDRWAMSRESGRMQSFEEAKKERVVALSDKGVKTVPIDPDLAARRVLSGEEANRVFGLAITSEEFFGSPQDVEWTFRGDELYLLQSRPITTVTADDDKKSWYLGLRRSLDNLVELRRRIEDKLLPEMDREADKMAAIDLSELSDDALLEELRKREEADRKWESVYWDDFIPFAHGARLFGQVYNDTVRPSDPYEFVKLLGADGMWSVKRNVVLEGLAGSIRMGPDLGKALVAHDYDRADPAFMKALDEFMSQYVDAACYSTQCYGEMDSLVDLLLKMASRERGPGEGAGESPKQMEKDFISRFDSEEKEEILTLLELARASYRLRDDDNIHISRIKGELLLAIQEIEKRVGLAEADTTALREALSRINREKAAESSEAAAGKTPLRQFARQLVGQPAVPGVATGKARIIRSQEDLYSFKPDEVIVCDAIDPNMTFIVPLAAGIVERRGGMLIHGAIIAREYGLPCVTGVPDATRAIRDGDEITVDGYLGIVTVNRGAGTSEGEADQSNFDEPSLSGRARD